MNRVMTAPFVSSSLPLSRESIIVASADCKSFSLINLALELSVGAAVVTAGMYQATGIVKFECVTLVTKNGWLTRLVRTTSRKHQCFHRTSLITCFLLLERGIIIFACL
jgi:hypothetical protein